MICCTPVTPVIGAGPSDPLWFGGPLPFRCFLRTDETSGGGEGGETAGLTAGEGLCGQHCLGSTVPHPS